MTFGAFEDVAEIKKILDSCKKYSPKTFSNLINLHKDLNKNLTALFNNIDGNASNFDMFVTDISRYDHTFSIIGIAETNVDIDCKDVYGIPGYISEYNEKKTGKKNKAEMRTIVKLLNVK